MAIFGATSAIAAETAKLYARRGARLFLAGRDAAKLTALAETVEGLGAAVEMEITDLTHTHHHDALLDHARAFLGGLDIAIIAHGVLPDQRDTEREFAAAARVFEVNLLSVISLLMRIANHMEIEGQGSIAVISSVAGDRGRPGNYTYGASKAALSAYLQGLRARMFKKGVRVITVKPGFVDTPMTARMRKNALFASPSQVAEGIIDAIDRGRAVAYLPWFWRPIMEAVKAIPEEVFKRLDL